MANRVLIHKLNDGFMIVNVTGAGPKAQFVPANQYSSWKMLSEELASRGLSKGDIDKAELELTANGTTAVSY